MAQILNVKIPLKKNFKSSLRLIYGIGYHRAEKIASILGLHSKTRIEHLFELDSTFINNLIDKSFAVDFELRRRVTLNIESLIELRTFRGYRHKLGLPTRGQRTHTNASTARKLLVYKSKTPERTREKNRGPKRKMVSNKKNKK